MGRRRCCRTTAESADKRIHINDIRKAVGSQLRLELTLAAGEGSPAEDSPGLEGERAKSYQSLAAVLNFLALDRTDLQFAAKELMRKLSAPRVIDEARLKRAVRYLK